MELVYLWIEEYKNIKKEGFNFSPNFKCNYSKQENKLKIEALKNQISIFPENINVTAIAGRNGTGKSSILELIAQILSNEIIDIQYILLTEESDFICNTNINGIKFDINTELNMKKKSNDDNFYIYQSSSFVNGYFDDLLDNFSSKLYKHYKESNIRNQSWLNQFLNGDRILESYSIENTLRYVNKHAHYNDQFLTIFKNAKILMQLDFVSKFKSIFNVMNLPNRLIISIEHNNNTVHAYGDSFYDRVRESIKNYHTGKALETQEDYDGQLTKNEEELLKIIENKYASIGPNDKISLDLNDAMELLNVYSSIGIKIFEVSWYGLSTGQDSFLNLFTLLMHGIESFYEKNKEQDQITNVIIALDEIENNFHPLWQKTLMQEVISFVNILKSHYGFKFHLLFSTHSPFIIADLPKENIIFLDNARQVNPFKDNEQTFGANIHKLMSHGFFMSDKGLMGDFATKHINKVIKNLEMKKPEMSQIEIKLLIEMIGEPFLQSKLKEKYIDRFPFENEISQLEYENKKLEEKQRNNQKRIEEIRNKGMK